MSPRSGQLDEISQAIGHLSGQVEAIDKYTHEREHSINNLSQKVDALGNQITREVARMKAELQVQLDAMDRRIATLEASNHEGAGAKRLVVLILQSPLLGWLALAGAFTVASIKGWLKP